MKILSTLAAGFVLLTGLSAAAQEDKDALKRDVLKKVEERLKAEEDRLLKDIEKLLDEELKPGAKAPAVAPPVKPVPAPAPKKARGYMGVRPGDLTDEEKEKLGIKSGIKVVEVPEGGPAHQAGLKAGDVITAMDGRAIDSPQEVPGIVQAAGAGTKLKVDVLRDGKKQTLEVTLGRHPLDPPEADPKAEAPKKEEPKEGDLRERVKKFLQKEEPKAEAPKPEPRPAEPAPGDDLFAFDEQMFEQFRGIFEQFGMDPEQFFQKGKDDKYRLNDEWKQLFKGLDLEKLFGRKPAEEPAPEPAPKPAPKAEAAPSGPRPWIGVQPEELSPELRSQLDIPDGVGLLIAEVVEGGPAMKAGLKKNDILLKIDGQGVKGEESLATFMKSAKAGQEATLTVIRKAKEQTIKVTVGEKKE